MYRALPRGTPEGYLVGAVVGWEIDWRQTGECNRSTGNAAAALDDFEPDAIGEFVSLGFMHLDQDVFFVCLGDLPFGINLGPIEDAGVVIELAAGGKQIRCRQRLAGSQGGDVQHRSSAAWFALVPSVMMSPVLTFGPSKM